MTDQAKTTERTMRWRGARQRRWPFTTTLIVALAMFSLPIAGVPPAHTHPRDGSTGTYTNPLLATIPGSSGVNDDCPDPSIIQGQTVGDTAWYAYCTSGPLNNNDRDASGTLNPHRIKVLSSYDLVHWTYQGDVFPTRPAWLTSDNTWAPDIRYVNHQYYLYYTGPDTIYNGSAIFVVTATTPLGPWSGNGTPVVEPEAPPSCCDGSARWTYDSALVTDDSSGQTYIFYGSFFGGVSARLLSADGLSSSPASRTPIAQITIPNKYEGSYVVKHGGYYYLFVSATNCCNGPLTYYGVFAGRSTNVLGPYLDREGNSLLAGRTGGTPVIAPNGNRFVGPGHNAVFTDAAGQDWFLYHAVDTTAPYFTKSDGSPAFTKRPLMMDALDWGADGWPVVRGGQGPSDTPQPAPAAQVGMHSGYTPTFAQNDQPGAEISALSDEFNGTSLSPQWSWVRPPTSGMTVSNGSFSFDTQAADLYVDTNNASVLTEPTPSGDYMVETQVHLNVPPEGCCYNFVQAGLVIYGDDDNFIKLTPFANYETRQTEFAKELKPVPPGYPRYGNGVVGPPGGDANGLDTYLRIVKTTGSGGVELYRAYTSQDGQTWVRGGVWTHTLGPSARIGLVAMGGSGFTATFDYVRVYALAASGGPGDGGTGATPELGSGELLGVGLATIGLTVLRRRRATARR